MNIEIGQKVRVLVGGPAVGREPIKKGDIVEVINRGVMVTKEGAWSAHFVPYENVEVIDPLFVTSPTTRALQRLEGIVSDAVLLMTALNTVIHSGGYFPDNDSGHAATKLFFDALNSIEEARDQLDVALEVARSDSTTTPPDEPSRAAA